MKKSIFKKWWFGIILSVMILGVFVGCSNDTGNKVTKEDKSTAASTTKKEEPKKEEPKKEEKVYKVGDTIKVNDKYQVIINKVFLTKERNEFHEQKVNKVAVIEYSYKNIAADEDLFISEMNFKIYDEEGNALETYPAGVNKMPQNIAKGKQCTAEMAYGFNKGTKLELHFYDNMFSSKSDFKILVEAK